MDLKIPPPVVAIIFATLMWAVDKTVSLGQVFSEHNKAIAITVLVIGLLIDVSALWAFRAARTTINPLKPENTSRLVQYGIFRFSRNPMYLGLTFILAGWAISLGNLLNIATLIFFVGYITRFQIMPEEKMLRNLFPDEYPEYQQRVRRWI